MLTYNVENEEVLFCRELITRIDRADVQQLVALAKANRRERIRLCSHCDTSDTLHEMFIVHVKDTYIPPHKHLNKAESIHIIEGLVDVIIFNDNGSIKETIPMGDYNTNRRFYCRLSDAYYHTLLIKTDFLVFHETTTGPFKRSDTIFAPWAPDGNSEPDCKEFLKTLEKKIKER